MAGHVFAAGKGLCKASGPGTEKNLFPWELVQKLEQHKSADLCCKAERLSWSFYGALSLDAHDGVIQPKTCTHIQAYYSSDINGMH